MTSRFRNFGVAPTHHVLFAKPFDVFTLLANWQILGLNFVRIVKVVSFQYLGVFFFFGGGAFRGVPFFFWVLQNLFPKNPRKNSAAWMATCRTVHVTRCGRCRCQRVWPRIGDSKISPTEFWRWKVNKKVLFWRIWIRMHQVRHQPTSQLFSMRSLVPSFFGIISKLYI